MTLFFKAINKYIVILIGASLFGMPWFYLRSLLMINPLDPSSIFYTLPGYIDVFARLLCVAALIIDFRKYRLKQAWAACLGSIMHPLLGVTIFALLFLENQSNSTDNNNKPTEP